MKIFLRKVFELPALFALREQVWRRAATKASQSARRVAFQHGYQALDTAEDFFGPRKSRESLFLLGGGSSINELTGGHFDHIRSRASIGFNVWAIHPFIPDVYSFETGKDQNRPGEDTQFQPTLPATSRNLVQVPESLRNNQFMYGRANLPTRDASNLLQDVHRVLRAYKLGRNPNNVFLDNGATVVRMLVFGALQGFRNIVLIGIDLDDRPYFWLAPDYPFRSEEIARVFPRRSGLPHDTLETLNRPFPVDRLVLALSHVLKKSFGITVYVGNSRSTLAPSIPVYPWPAT
jgi:hypothetical protein